MSFYFQHLPSSIKVTDDTSQLPMSELKAVASKNTVGVTNKQRQSARKRKVSMAIVLKMMVMICVPGYEIRVEAKERSMEKRKEEERCSKRRKDGGGGSQEGGRGW